MSRALFLKEWRQLRTLRWGALVLTAVLPVALVVGAEAARRGWAFGTVKDYAAKTLWGEAFPAVLALAVWPLFTALMAAHSWCAEREDGTVAFLLARPVPAARAWWAKLGAVVSSITLVHLLGTTLVAALAITSVPWDRVQDLLMWALSAWLLLFALAAAVAASSAFIPSTGFAALLGVVFGVGVSFAAFQVAVLFPLARAEVLGRTIPASAAFVLYVPAFALASLRGFSRGEPAGRRRALRAGRALGWATGLVAAAFIVVAWGMVRWNLPPRGGTGWIAAASLGPTIAAGSDASVPRIHLVDGRTGRVTKSFPGPVGGLAWNDDGTELAVASLAGPLGSIRGQARLLVFGSAGDPRGVPIDLPSDSPWRVDLRWAGSRLAALYSRDVVDGQRGFLWSVAIADPAVGTVRTVEMEGRSRFAWFDGPTESGSLFVLLADFSTGPAPDHRRTSTGPWRCYRVQPDAATVTLESSVSGRGFPPLFRSAISPSGRWLLGFAGDTDDSPRVVLDRSTGASVETPAVHGAVWMHGDVLVGKQEKEGKIDMIGMIPGGVPRTVASWSATEIRFQASPDRRRLLVSGDAQAVWDATLDRWIDVPRVDTDPRLDTIQWAGPTTLAWRGPDYLVLADLDALDKRRVVFGKDPFVKGPAEN